MGKSFKKNKTYFEEEDFETDDQRNRRLKDRRQKKLSEQELIDLMLKEGFGG